MRAIILSAELSTLPAIVNAQRTAHLKALLKAYGLHAKRALGRYHGTEETSFIVSVDALHAAETLQVTTELARHFDQESILDINGGIATLRDSQGVPIRSLTLVAEALCDHRPERDHTAVPVGSRYLVLEFA